MGDEKYMFVGLGWGKKIRILKDPNVHFNQFPEYDIDVANRCSDDYEMTPFLHFTQWLRFMWDKVGTPLVSKPKNWIMFIFSFTNIFYKIWKYFWEKI